VRVGIIGLGAIGRDLVEILGRDGHDLTMLVRPGREAAGAVTSLEDMLAWCPDVVVECAGHAALAAFGPAVLRAGVDLVVASVGALADPAVMAALVDAARAGGARVTVPSGAIGGIDALGAARLSGLRSVTYTGRKPPAAWAGSLAETVVDLASLTREAVIFEGSAREAARLYPKNANVAATLALAGMGLDATRVRLVADPAAPGNVHEVEVDSEALAFSIRLEGRPSPANPRTSRSTVYSIARAVLNRAEAIVI
jgi:aspartate dehydrogenase